MRRALLLLLASGACLVASAAPAGAEVGDLTFAGCVANDSAQGCVDLPNSPIPTSIGATDIKLSPDGTSLYIAGSDAMSNGIISQFNRGADGSLSYVGCIGDVPGQGCTDIPNTPLQSLGGIALSPDGDSLYAASVSSQSLTHFTRDATGKLTFERCLASTAAQGCTDVGGANSPLENVSKVTVSPDGASIYMLGESGGSGGGRLARFSADAAGVPTYVSCLADDSSQGCGPSTSGGLVGRSALIATDGSLYALGGAVRTITRYDRTTFTFAQCLTSAAIPACSQTPSSLGTLRGAALSPDGTSIYASARSGPLENGVITQLAVGENGALTYKGCVADSEPGCVDLPNSPLSGATNVAISPDGASLYATATGSDAVSTFRRGADGSLSFAGCFANDVAQGCSAIPGGPLNNAVSVATSPDGRNVYVSSISSQSISVFNRELPADAFDFGLAAKGKQKVGRLSVKATCSAACDVSVRAKGRAGKKFKSKELDFALPPGTTRVKIKLKKSVVRKVDDRKGKVTFAATATSDAGATASDTAKAKLKP